MLADVLRNLGVVLFGTAAGLAAAVVFEAWRASRTAGPPAHHIYAVVTWAVALHLDLTIEHLLRLNDRETVGPYVLSFVLLGLVGNIALVVMLRVMVARRIIGHRLEAELDSAETTLADHEQAELDRDDP
jgi:hypothetical protein